MGLLKNIDPLLIPDLLHILRSMVATQTTSGKHCMLTVSLPEALQAICSVLPLDFFAATQAVYMGPQEHVEVPPAGLEVVSALQVAIRGHCPDAIIEPLERFAFYEEAKTCFAVVQTMERRPYGNVVLTKGCVGPGGLDLKP
mmetsp:Transcript_87696/g.175435  ORF Transcript_87696/g.175435 Transcript_87696/m.175435 type:complete len:142 (-) Transcript_87696:80-505(-)